MSIELIAPQAITVLAKDVGQWVSATHASLAREKAAQLYGKQADKAIIYTDGAKGRAPEQVKPFGQIVYAPPTGPIAEAIAMALEIIRSRGPSNRETGFYASDFQWYVNGKPVAGVPDGKTIGPSGNVQVANLAPYATMQEIQVPRGVLYAAFTVLKRAFGQRLVLGYGYRLARGAFVQDQPKGKEAPTNVPTLMIASPGGKVRSSVKVPGSKIRKAKRLKRVAIRARRNRLKARLQ
jgi:hypothetical protein